MQINSCMHVQQLESKINHSKLIDDFKALNENVLFDPITGQISVTSIEGDNDWTCSVGKIHMLKKPERFYCVLNKMLAGSEFEKVVKAYPEFYRWRLMQLGPRQIYSIHSDSNGNGKRNKRLHIPLVSNPNCYMMFIDDDITKPTMYHLDVGKVYEVDTTNRHTALNCGIHNRVHLVGVRYE